MSKKIGVVANHQTINYGTMLQALALQTALETLDYEVETIDFSGMQNQIKQKKIEYLGSKISKKELLHSKFPTIKKKICSKLLPSFKENLHIREQRFTDFRERTFPMSAKIDNMDQLALQSLKYDVVVVGSDQIWLPTNIWADIFTLNFVPDTIKKMSYASSFGISQLPESVIPLAEKFLNRFNSLSVREKTGQKIIKDIAHRDAFIACDPTMLFSAEQWDTIFPHKSEHSIPYIFTYFLGNNRWQRDFVKKFSKQTGIKIVSILHMDEYIFSDNSFADEAVYNVGPEDFMELIRNATYIFTDSFHGTVFSTLYKKNVFTFDRFDINSQHSTNTRIDYLFELTNLYNRRLNNSSSIDDCINVAPIDETTLLRIEKIRNDSWNYLKQALEE